MTLNTRFPTTIFGTEISSDDVVAAMQACRGWEDRYRQVIQWGKKLPVMADELKSERVKVAGCESQVWLVSFNDDGVWSFHADSDARIVRGLIAIVLAAYDGKSSEEIQSFDIEHYFSALGLIDHLSPSRGNGLKAIVEQIRTMTC